MTQKSFAALLAVALGMSSGAARAQADASADEGQQLVERVAVRNRLYSTRGRVELGAAVGLTIVTRLTDHYNFNGSVAYNFSERLAAEIRGGYAYARQTGVARQVAEHLLQRDPASQLQVTEDLSGLWEMKANALVGARWAPIYGKISLLSEVPVHFQTYLWAGLGGGTFHRQSVVMCLQVLSRADGRCGSYFEEDKSAVIGSGAFGFRFFTHPHGGLKLEVRSWLFPDSFRENINRLEAEKGNINGTLVANPGLTNLVMFDLGYSFLF
jgi:outer membrane beta-barrel protein